MPDSKGFSSIRKYVERVTSLHGDIRRYEAKNNKADMSGKSFRSCLY